MNFLVLRMVSYKPPKPEAKLDEPAQQVPDEQRVYRAVTDDDWFDDTGHRLTYLAFILREFEDGELEAGLSVGLTQEIAVSLPAVDTYGIGELITREIHGAVEGIRVMTKSGVVGGAEILGLSPWQTRKERGVAVQQGTDLAEICKVIDHTHRVKPPKAYAATSENQ